VFYEQLVNQGFQKGLNLAKLARKHEVALEKAERCCFLIRFLQ
jgi:hypothetical protein